MVKMDTIFCEKMVTDDGMLIAMSDGTIIIIHNSLGICLHDVFPDIKDVTTLWEFLQNVFADDEVDDAGLKFLEQLFGGKVITYDLDTFASHARPAANAAFRMKLLTQDQLCREYGSLSELTGTICDQDTTVTKLEEFLKNTLIGNNLLTMSDGVIVSKEAQAVIDDIIKPIIGKFGGNDDSLQDNKEASEEVHTATA